MLLTIERKLPLILFVIVIVSTFLGFVLYQYTASLQDAVDIEKRRQNVVSQLDETLRLTLAIESSLNSFIITGNDTYLLPYQTAKQKIPQNLAQIRSLVADVPDEIEEVDRLGASTTDYLAQVDRKIERRKIEGFDAAIMSLSDASERSITANIRQTIDRLKYFELNALQQQEKQLDRSFYRTIWVLIVGCLAGIVALGLANLVVSREIGKRRDAESALRDANKDLETKIEQRTDELAKLNESLRTAADERETLLKNEKSARREAEIANRLRDEFMAAVSHELKTPLNSILGWARMLNAGELDEHQVKKALGTIIKNSETQNRLIEDLLDVARLISGKLVLDLEPIDPVELLHDSIQSVQPSAQSKHLTISEQMDSNSESTIIRGDRNRLMQVFSNILANAVKFTPEHGRIETAVESRDSMVQFTVRDNGIGIDPEFIPDVFERFRQDRSVTTRNGGLGLGLAIVRQLVDMHGGAVRVSSEGRDKGSTFTVELPSSPQEDLQL